MSLVENKKSKPKYTSERYLNILSGLQFGTDKYIDLTSRLLQYMDDSTDLTISLFFRVDYQATNRSVLFQVGDNTALPDFFIKIALTGLNSAPTLSVKIDDVEVQGVGITGISADNIWYHVVVTRESATGLTKLYLNNRLLRQDTLTFNKVVDSNWKVYMGRETAITIPEDTLEGEIAHLKVFNKALDQDEISFIHRWAGRIPESAMANIVEHQPLQYNSFVNDSVFKSREIATTFNI